MKTKSIYWIVGVCLALLIGMLLGYLAMPEKVKTETIASQCQECQVCQACPSIPTEITCKKIVSSPKSSDTSTDEQIEKTLRTSLSCKDWLKKQGLGYMPDLPFCWQPKNLIELQDLDNGCKVIYSDC